MDNKVFFECRDKAVSALDDDNLSLGLSLAETLLTSVEGCGELYDKLNELKQSYALMLNYISNGNESMANKEPYNRFLIAAYNLIDGICREYVLQKDLYVSHLWKTIARQDRNWAEYMPLSKNVVPESAEAAYQIFFNSVWLSSLWKDDDLQTAMGMMENADLKNDYKLLFISAVTLSSYASFDEKKFLLLANHVSDASTFIAARAIIGVLLIYKRHYKRVRLYENIEARLRLLCDEPGFREKLKSLHLQCILTSETKNIEKNLREEIIPGIMKGAEGTFDFKKKGLASIDEIIEDVASNPEWQEMMVDKSVVQNMERIAELQEQGADMFISTFSSVYTQLPFFSVAANWFLPFSSSHPLVENKGMVGQFIKNILSGDRFSNTDKYSLAMMMQRMGASNMTEGKNPFVPESVDLSESSEKWRRGEIERKNYLQDIYRFFLLFHCGKKIENPFDNILLIMDLPVFCNVLLEVGHLRSLAEFLFKHGYVAYAYSFFKRIPGKDLQAKDYQKMGFCLQKEKNYFDASLCYLNANELEPDNVWVLKQLAVCSRALGNTDVAIECYEKLEGKSPEDADILLRIGECYLQEDEPEKAKTYLYKANYLSPENLQITRALAWCLLLTGDYDAAIRNLEKIITASALPSDFYNLGHAHLLSGNIQEAIEAYRRCVKSRQKNFAEADFFDEDMSFLKCNGLMHRDFHLMVDLINAEDSKIG